MDIQLQVGNVLIYLGLGLIIYTSDLGRAVSFPLPFLRFSLSIPREAWSIE